MAQSNAGHVSLSQLNRAGIRNLSLFRKLTRVGELSYRQHKFNAQNTYNSISDCQTDPGQL
jgi:hypothetical protein